MGFLKYGKGPEREGGNRSAIENIYLEWRIPKSNESDIRTKKYQKIQAG